MLALGAVLSHEQLKWKIHPISASGAWKLILRPKMCPFQRGSCWVLMCGGQSSLSQAHHISAASSQCLHENEPNPVVLPIFILFSDSSKSFPWCHGSWHRLFDVFLMQKRLPPHPRGWERVSPVPCTAVSRDHCGFCQLRVFGICLQLNFELKAISCALSSSSYL